MSAGTDHVTAGLVRAAMSPLGSASKLPAPGTPSATWQGGTSRGSRPFFGNAADEYQDLRPGYPSELVTRVLEYAGQVRHAVEVGAGTGKATDAFVRAGLTVECIEPDPVMAAKIRSRYGAGAVAVTPSPFEQWTPAAPPRLIFAAQSWHWLNARTRCRRAAAALAAGGSLALFGHRFLIADDDLAERVDRPYLVHAPHLIGDPGTQRVTAAAYWYTAELLGSGDFQEVEAFDFDRLLRYDVEAYLRLVATFSSHRDLGPKTLARLIADLRVALHDVDHVDVELGTVLALGRSPVPAGLRAR